MTTSDSEDDNDEASVETTQIHVHPADVQEQVAQSACSTSVTSSLKQGIIEKEKEI